MKLTRTPMARHESRAFRGTRSRAWWSGWPQMSLIFGPATRYMAWLSSRVMERLPSLRAVRASQPGVEAAQHPARAGRGAATDLAGQRITPGRASLRFLLSFV